MKEAMLYKKLANDMVQCRLCNHFCAIKPGNRGICAVRENVSGKLFTLVYGKAVSEAIDPVEKKPLFHFLPGTRTYSVATVGCNFSCTFCQNWEISQAPRLSGKVEGYDLSPEKIVSRAALSGCPSISYTYTEPTIFFEYAYDTAVIAHKRGLKNIFVSNGFMTKEAIDKIAPYLDAINVDIKGSTEEFYRGIVGARLQPILDNVKYLWEKGVWVEVTTLIVPRHNDDDKSLKKIAEFVAGVDVNMPWHVSRFFPHYRMSNVMPTTTEVLKRAYRIGKKAGLKYIYVGNVPASGYENTLCPKCGKVVIERGWYEIGSIDVKEGKCGFCGEKIAGIWKI